MQSNPHRHRSLYQVLNLNKMAAVPGRTAGTTGPGKATLIDLRNFEPASDTATMADNQPRVLLNSGHSMPLVGLGTWKGSGDEVKEAVIAAVKAGYRHIDCAAVYGNEDKVGEALQTVIHQDIVKREQLHITSKLWNTEHEPSRVEPALRKTLHDLKVPYLDLYLIHWPSSQPGPTINPPIIDTWRAMEACVDKGLVRSIGVSNFSAKKLGALLKEARIKPAVDQVEAHPLWNNHALFEWCAAHGIHMTAYSPLGSPDSAEMMKRAEDTPSPMKHPLVKEIAEKLGKSPAQILIRWALQRGTSVLPKSTHADRIASNLDVFSWSIPDNDFNKLSNIKEQIRMVGGTFLVNKEGPYKRVEDLWDEDTPAAVPTQDAK